MSLYYFLFYVPYLIFFRYETVGVRVGVNQGSSICKLGLMFVALATMEDTSHLSK